MKKSILLGLLFLFIPFVSWSYSKDLLKESALNLIQFDKNFSSSQIDQVLLKAKNRKNILLNGWQNDPSSLQQYLLPSKITDLLPKKIKLLVEQEITNLEGKIEINVADDFHAKQLIEYVLKAKNGDVYYLAFLNTPPAYLMTGDNIKISHAHLISSVENRNYIILSSNEVIKIENQTIAIPTAFGPQKTLVMLVNFQDKPSVQPFTPSHVNTSVFTNLNNKYYEFSFNQTTVVGDVVGWFTVAMNSTDSCNNLLNRLAGLARSAATNSGVDLSKYARQVIIFPLFNACSWGGYSSIGGSPSVSYINGSDSPSIIAHEMGHALGIHHSHSLECNGTTNTGTCSVNEYGNLADSMGNPWNYNGPHFNAFQKERLGWLNYQISPPIQQVTTSGTYVIDTYETLNRNIKALKILKSKSANGSNNYYYLEFRQGVGEDKYLGTCTSCDYTKGILITQANDTDPASSELLDMTPTDSNRGLTTLLPGKSFTDPDTPNGPLTITTNSVSSGGANVTIAMGAPTCVRKAHSMNISPTGTQYVKAGESADYTLTLTNNDNAVCNSSNFELITSGQMSWIPAKLDKKSVQLAPGESSVIVLTVKASTTAPVNIYNVSATAKNLSLANIESALVQASFGVSK